jgi:predicted 3-demethylubiquinone-9 3-methyltransferase (glyoxalase superfamily)
VQKITPFLWFDNQAEEAANFYVSIFKNSKIVTVTRYGDAGPGPKGQVMTAAFELEGQRFTALNGGKQPNIKFTEAISFVVQCDNQQEIDYYWSKFGEGTTWPGQCGWIKDKFGVSWQVVPKELPQLLSGEPERSQRVMQALMKMTKLDVAELKRAAGEPVGTRS